MYFKNLINCPLYIGLLCVFAILTKAQAQQLATSAGNQSVSSQLIDKKQNTTILWAEDFSSGIPATWENVGSADKALWEYRGPNTVPNNTVGSRGAYNGNLGPIQSKTTGNGFVIFDSDYLDSYGVITSWGGPAPAPHVGTLQTEPIDLSGEPNVELVFSSMARRFACRFLVAFSTDGGQTFPDTLEYFDTDDIYVNQMTSVSEVSHENVSQIIGGKSQVVLQFIFDGTEVVSNTSGYYFWMLDDISIRRVSHHALKIVDRHATSQEGVIYNNDTNYAAYGILNINQVVPLKFDAQILNYGSTAQSNVGLMVEIWNKATGKMELSLKSPTCQNLPPFDTCFENTLNTIDWTPSRTGEYYLIYKAFSDSVSGYGHLHTHVSNQIVSDTLYGLDRGNNDGYESSSHASKLAVKYHLTNENPDSAGSKKVYLKGVNIGLGPGTDSTALITFSLFDTTGYPHNPNTAVYSETYTVGKTKGEDSKNFLFNNGSPVSLPTGVYFLEVHFMPQAFQGFISVKNDRSIRRTNDNVYFKKFGNTWLPGSWKEENNAPWLRLVTHNSTSSSVSLKESITQPVSVYPNPSDGFIFIRFDEAGIYKLLLFDTSGRKIKSFLVEANGNQAIRVEHHLPANHNFILKIFYQNVSYTFPIHTK